MKKRNIEPGLFVFDDVPDSGLISPLMEPLMRESTDSILLTTRDRRVALAMAGPGNIIEVIPMDKFSAATMLRSCISPSVELDAGEFDDVLGIVEILECTPQAVVQAAIYISSACVKPREFLAILRDIETQGDILSHKPGVSGAQSILEQIRITIVQLDPRSRHLLTLMAFLGEDPIPESLLHAIDESKSSSLEAVNQLQSLYLISTDWESHANRRSYFVHNLVRIAVRLDAMVTNTITSIQEKALAIISEKFPSGEYDTWAECELLLSAALAVTNNVLSYEDSRLQRATLLSKVSRYATLRFAYDGLIWDTLPGMCETAFQAYEELLGGEHPETLNSASAWVVVMQLQGRFHHAKELLQRTLGLTEKVFGHYSLHYMDRLYLMANLLRDQAYYHDGPYEQPLQLYQDIVKWDEEVIGSEHPDALVRLNALAVTLYAEGEIGQAINMSKHVLDARLRIIGKEHTDTLTSMIDFAQMLCGQGRVEEGRQWLKEAFFYRPVLSGAAGRHKFASILLDQNELDRARMICEDAFEHISTGILRQVPQILETVSTFGSVLMALELYSAAEIRFEEARAGWEKIFGPDHRLSIECLQRRTEASDKIMRQKQLEVDSSDAISKMTTRLKESTQTSSTPEKQSKMPLQSEKRPGSRSGSQQQLKISRSMDQVTFPSVLTKLIKTILPFENTNWPGLGRFGESQHLFLGKVLPAHHIPNMLGRLVFDRADPLREFIPHSENLGPLNPPDIVTTIGDAPVTYSEVSGILKSADAYRARSRMMNAALMTSPLLRLFYLQAFPSIDFEALGVNQYNMVSHSQILNTLVQDGHFREQLFELIRATGQSTFFMVTSMLTARKLTRTTAAAKHTGFRNDVVGAELSVDVGLPTGETTLVTSRDERIRIEQDVIFALAYEKVEVQRDRWGIRTVISAEKRASSPSKPVVRYRGRGFRVSYF